eukprot:12807050-Prorocentrum_lima.AAC.1
MRRRPRKARAKYRRRKGRRVHDKADTARVGAPSEHLSISHPTMTEMPSSRGADVGEMPRRERSSGQ